MNESPVDLVNELRSDLGWDSTFATAAEKEYRRWLTLRAKASDYYHCQLPPSRVVAIVWSVHRQWTMDYHNTCNQLGGFIHHYPPAMRMTVAMEQAYNLTIQRYRSEFNEDPPASHWGPAIVSQPAADTDSTRLNKDTPSKPATATAVLHQHTHHNNNNILASSNNAPNSQGDEDVVMTPQGNSVSSRALRAKKRNVKVVEPNASNDNEITGATTPTTKVKQSASNQNQTPAPSPATPQKTPSKTQKSQKQTQKQVQSQPSTPSKSTPKSKNRRVSSGSPENLPIRHSRVDKGFVLRPLAPGEKRRVGRPKNKDYLEPSGKEKAQASAPAQKEDEQEQDSPTTPAKAFAATARTTTPSKASARATRPKRASTAKQSSTTPSKPSAAAVEKVVKNSKNQTSNLAITTRSKMSRRASAPATRASKAGSSAPKPQSDETKDVPKPESEGNTKTPNAPAPTEAEAHSSKSKESTAVAPNNKSHASSKTPPSKDVTTDKGGASSSTSGAKPTKISKPTTAATTTQPATIVVVPASTQKSTQSDTTAPKNVPIRNPMVTPTSTSAPTPPATIAPTPVRASNPVAPAPTAAPTRVPAPVAQSAASPVSKAPATSAQSSAVPILPAPPPLPPSGNRAGAFKRPRGRPRKDGSMPRPRKTASLTTNPATVAMIADATAAAARAVSARPSKEKKVNNSNSISGSGANEHRILGQKQSSTTQSLTAIAPKATAAVVARDIGRNNTSAASNTAAHAAAQAAAVATAHLQQQQQQSGVVMHVAHPQQNPGGNSAVNQAIPTGNGGFNQAINGGVPQPIGQIAPNFKPPARQATAILPKTVPTNTMSIGGIVSGLVAGASAPMQPQHTTMMNPVGNAGVTYSQPMTNGSLPAGTSQPTGPSSNGIIGSGPLPSAVNIVSVPMPTSSATPFRPAASAPPQVKGVVQIIENKSMAPPPVTLVGNDNSFPPPPPPAPTMLNAKVVMGSLGKKPDREAAADAQMTGGNQGSSETSKPARGQAVEGKDTATNPVQNAATSGSTGSTNGVPNAGMTDAMQTA